MKNTAVRVSFISIVINTVLAALKVLAGIFAHSGAMISDGVHSASDVFSSFIVIIGIRLAGKEADPEHPYGHERFECAASIVLASILAVTGFQIGRSAVLQIIGSASADSPITVPTLPALLAAALSIVVKESMYWYTRAYAKKLNSGALMADAWHHRSDALSSIGALIGIGGAMLGVPVLEPVASLVICIFIFKAVYDIFKDAMEKMVDHSCPEELEHAISDFAAAQPEVLGVDLIRTREFGNRIYVDIEISADGSKTLEEGHQIAEQVHEAIEEQFPSVKHIMVHVNPA